MSDKTTGQGIAMHNVAQGFKFVWGSVQPWCVRNVTFGLVLAVATEAPRWVFAFVGAHEPVWAGIAVAVLLSFAAAQGWDEYFRKPDPLLLCMLVAQIASALIIITPVVLAMAQGEGHAVQLKNILTVWVLWVWSATLVVSTFLPLIIVAYVEVRRHERSMQLEVQPKAKKVALPTVDSVQPTVQPVAPIVQIAEIDEVIGGEDDLLDGCPDQSDKPAYAKWLHMEKGMSQTALGTMFGVHRNTVGKWLRDADRVAS